MDNAPMEKSFLSLRSELLPDLWHNLLIGDKIGIVSYFVRYSSLAGSDRIGDAVESVLRQMRRNLKLFLVLYECYIV